MTKVTRSVLLTFRMHRFEVLFAVGVLVLTGISTVIATSQAEAANLSQACWDETYRASGAGEDIRVCRHALQAFWKATETAGFVWGPIAAFLPWISGLVLGVPLVGRELESGTASLAWSLTGRRSRWLLARILPMLALIVVGGAVLGFLLTRMAEAAQPFNEFLGPGRLPNLDDIGREGVPFVLRTVVAFGVGLLAGAVIGRTMPALVAGVVISVALWFALGVGLQSLVSGQVAIWRPYVDDGHSYNLHYVGSGFDDGEGRILTRAQLDETWDAEVCPGCGTRFDQDADGERLQKRYYAWREANFTQVFRTVPTERYADFERAEVLATLLIAGGAILLTFPVVSRRRPR